MGFQRASPDLEGKLVQDQEGSKCWVNDQGHRMQHSLPRTQGVGSRVGREQGEDLGTD